MTVLLDDGVRQVPGHYQALLPNKFGAFCPKKTCDIEDLIGILLEHDYKPFAPQGFLIVSAEIEETDDLLDMCFGDEEINSTWGTVEFSKEPHLFPTSVDSRWGAIVRHLSKEFYISFDEDDCLAIGHEDKLYRFANPTISEDCLEIYAMVFEGIIPESSTKI